MKRLTLLTILLVVVGLTAGALEVKPAFTLSGTGTLEWGIDLDNQTTGFKNSATGDLVITLMAADGTDTHAGTGDWYGSISIANVELYWTDGAATAGVADANVTAKIVGLGGALAIGVVPVAGPNGPDLTLDFVPNVEADSDATDAVVDNEVDLLTNYDGFGTYVSYSITKDIMVGLEAVSELPWTTNLNNAYALALDVSAKFAPITVAAGFNYGFNYAATPIGFGVKVSADTAMIDPWVAFDGQSAGAVFTWEVGAGATLTVMETVTATLGALFDSADNLDLKVVFTEPAAKGLVDNLDASLTVYLLDLITALEYEVILAGGYKAGVLYPHFSVTYGDDNAAAATLKAMVGVAIDPLFPLTKLEIHWTSGDLLAATPVLGTIVAGVTVTY